MDAPRKLFRSVVAAICFESLAVSALAAGTSYATPNFIVYAPTPDIAKTIALAAEEYRRDLAIEWLGHALPRWAQPCPVKVKIGQIGAGGATTFTFHPTRNGSAEVCGWDMQIQGSLERILDSVLPHEVSHTIFACHFRRPLPRWADEGAATLVEHESERRRQILTVKQVLGTKRRIPLRQLLAIKEYPKDMQDVLTLYAEGYTLADLLVQKGGKTRYLKFLADAHTQGWDKAVTGNYEYESLDELEKDWHGWIVAGCPTLNVPAEHVLVEAGNPAKRPEGQVVVRGQSPPDDPFLEASPLPADKSRPSDRDGFEVASTRAPAVALREAPREQAATPAVLGPRDEPTTPMHNARVARETAAAPMERSFAESVRIERQSFQAPRQVPSAVAQRQLGAARRAVEEPASSRPRASWSEFPSDPRSTPLALSR